MVYLGTVDSGGKLEAVVLSVEATYVYGIRTCILELFTEPSRAKTCTCIIQRLLSGRISRGESNEKWP